MIPEGELRVVRIENKKILLANHDRKFYAFEKNCPHMGHPLEDGRINPYGEIVCSLHTYRFDLATGSESSKRCRDLELFPVFEENEKLVIDFS